MRREYDFSKGKRGPVIPSPGKTRITIMLDDDVIEYFRSKAESEGAGYQTMINSALRAVLPTGKKRTDDQPVTIATLRKVLREELQPVDSARQLTFRSTGHAAGGQATGGLRPASAGAARRLTKR